MDPRGAVELAITGRVNEREGYYVHSAQSISFPEYS